MLSGVTCALSAMLVDIITLIRHVSPLLSVSEYSYVGCLQLVGVSYYAGACRQETQAIIVGVDNMIMRMILN